MKIRFSAAIWKSLTFLLVLLGPCNYSLSQSLRQVQLQELLDSLCQSGNFPGLSVAIANNDNSVFTLSTGYSDKEKRTPLSITDRMPQGSVGKTYVAAITMQILQQGKVNLDDKVFKYLGHYDWYARIPNASEITIKMLMNHTSGIMRYEFKEEFIYDLTNNPDKVWRPEELVAYVLDEKASFGAGLGWEYSDTNYILLGMIVEKVTGKKYYDLLQANILKKFSLTNTFPTEKRKVIGFAQGYSGGQQDKVVLENGLFIFNPQFEWTGGGVNSTTADLARWGKLLYEGKVFDPKLLALMLEGVPAKLGPDSRYGLGVILRPTPFGLTYGHSGFFPGYLTEMVYFPQQQICIAIQTNTSDIKHLAFRPFICALEIAKLIMESNK